MRDKSFNLQALSKPDFQFKDMTHTVAVTVAVWLFVSALSSALEPTAASRCAVCIVNLEGKKAPLNAVCFFFCALFLWMCVWYYWKVLTGRKCGGNINIKKFIFFCFFLFPAIYQQLSNVSITLLAHHQPSLPHMVNMRFLSFWC